MCIYTYVCVYVHVRIGRSICVRVRVGMYVCMYTCKGRNNYVVLHVYVAESLSNLNRCVRTPQLALQKATLQQSLPSAERKLLCALDFVGVLGGLGFRLQD